MGLQPPDYIWKDHIAKPSTPSIYKQGLSSHNCHDDHDGDDGIDWRMLIMESTAYLVRVALRTAEGHILIPSDIAILLPEVD